VPLFFEIFSASFLIPFLSPGIATSINIHVLFSLSRVMMSGLLLGMVLYYYYYYYYYYCCCCCCCCCCWSFEILASISIWFSAFRNVTSNTPNLVDTFLQTFGRPNASTKLHDVTAPRDRCMLCCYDCWYKLW
jgi:hypothetical protein